MKFLVALLVYAMMALVLGIGILRTVHGDPWLLVFGAVFYSLALGALGCLPKKSH